MDNKINTRTICFIIARRLVARHYEWAHFPDCHFRDDPDAKRWVPFQKVVRLLALDHNDAIKDRQDEELARHFAGVGIEEEGEAE